MGRLFLLLTVVLLCVCVLGVDMQAQPVFFSLLFPQLMPGYTRESGKGWIFEWPWADATPGEAVPL